MSSEEVTGRRRILWVRHSPRVSQPPGFPPRLGALQWPEQAAVAPRLLYPVKERSGLPYRLRTKWGMFHVRRKQEGHLAEGMAGGGMVGGAELPGVTVNIAFGFGRAPQHDGAAAGRGR
jgi:hypothetical protein